jgi:hypothetical protein
VGHAGSRKWIAAVVLALALSPSAALAWRNRTMPHLGIFHDDAIYLIAAKSLALGEGYRIASLPEQPHQTKYPPLFPLWLSLAWRVEPTFPANLPLVAGLCWVMLPFCVAGAWRLLRDAGFSLVEATSIAAWIALNPVAVMFGMLAMSELPALGLLLAALILAERAVRAPQAGGLPCWAMAGMAGFVGGAAFLARTAMLPLVVTAPVVFLLQGQRRAAAWFAGGMAPSIVGWQVWAWLHRAPAADAATRFYTDYFGYYLRDVTPASLPHLVWSNAGAAIHSAGELLLFESDLPWIGTTLARLLAVGVVAGAVRLWRRGALRHYSAFAVVFTVQLLLWNYPPVSRFLLPLLPLLAAAVYVELKHLASLAWKAFGKPKPGDRVAAVTVAVLLAALAGFALARTWYGLRTRLPSLIADRQETLEQARPAYDWLARQTGRVLACSDPVVYLYTGMRGISLRAPPGVLLRGEASALDQWFAALPELVERHGVSYVLVTRDDYNLDVPERSQPAWRSAIEQAGWSTQAFAGNGVTIYWARPRMVSLE